MLLVLSLWAIPGTGAEISGIRYPVPGIQGEREQWLTLHNRYRALHHGGPLQWSAALARRAGDFAATCPQGHSGMEYGENIAWSSSTQKPEGVMSRWYGEAVHYDYKAPGFSRDTGHFTQIVWQNTREVGCACRSDCNSSWKSVCVCLYDPPGNFRGRYPGNVLPPLQKKSQ